MLNEINDLPIPSCVHTMIVIIIKKRTDDTAILNVMNEWMNDKIVFVVVVKGNEK